MNKMAKYLKPQTPLQHYSGDYIYPITSVDQIITGNGERLNANLISIDLKDSVESDKVVLGTQAVPISIQEGGTGANNAAEARENLGITPENIGAMSMELLWQNGSPDSEFADQTITLDLSAYSHIMIETVSTPGVVFAHKGVNEMNIVYVGNTDATKTLIQPTRRIITVRDTHVSFTDAFTALYESSTSIFGDVTTNNEAAVPFRIYGIKGVSA